MNKAVQKALIELVLYMARMIIYQSNIFGITDTVILNQKRYDLEHALEEDN